MGQSVYNVKNIAPDSSVHGELEISRTPRNHRAVVRIQVNGSVSSRTLVVDGYGGGISIGNIVMVIDESSDGRMSLDIQYRTCFRSGRIVFQLLE